MNLAIITARGGSKRIPHKNIKDFCGKPIIHYSIKVALDSKLFDEVMVSTDDISIADLAKSFGANVPFMRSPSASDDFATTADVIKDVINCYSNIGKYFDTICCIYPTAPFLTDKKLKDAFSLLDKHNIDSVIPVVKYSFPPQRSFVIDSGFIKRQFPQYFSQRSQDLEPIYHDCGQFYFIKSASFKQYGSLLTDNTVPIVMSDIEVQDIDTLEDWFIAENKFKIMLSKESSI